MPRRAAHRPAATDCLVTMARRPQQAVEAGIVDEIVSRREPQASGGEAETVGEGEGEAEERHTA